MGLINYIKTKKRIKENEKYFAEEERIQKPIKLEVDKKNYDEAYKVAKSNYFNPKFDNYFTQTKLMVCLSLIDICYKLKNYDEINEYINRYREIDSSLNGKLHNTGAIAYYEIGKVMYENKKIEEAVDYLKKAYDLSGGTLFMTKEDKEKYLKILNIKDDRQFEDFSEDY